MAATHHAPNEIDVGIARVVDVLKINKPGIKIGCKEQHVLSTAEVWWLGYVVCK